MQPSPPKGFLGWFLGLPRYLYHAHLGVLLGHRFLVLVHEGRRSGRRRETPLEVVRYDRTRHEAIVAAGWGTKTQWLYNVDAGLAREVWIGRERYEPTVRRLDATEAQEVLAWYEDHNGLPKSIVRGVLSRLVGWRYDGSPQARARLVRQLPMVAFRPAGLP
jgi:deazaflavin-dependent oxidoreductase (nitroreductase family)